MNIITDASQYASGAVLSQGTIGSDLPVAYPSRSVHPSEIKFSAIEKELMVIVWIVKAFKPWSPFHYSMRP